jgi:hypothetical protein
MAILKAFSTALESRFSRNSYGTGMHWDAVVQFNQRFYANGIPKIVLFGINPGRLGAGKTGVPFVDFKSLSRLLAGISRADSERSAQFFFRVIEHFDAERFYASFYVTNVSWVGYVKDARNVNFHELPGAALQKVLDLFREEMAVVKPAKIISLSGSVHETVRNVLRKDVDCSTVLPHPNYCSFESRVERYMSKYIESFTPFVRA